MPWSISMISTISFTIPNNSTDYFNISFIVNSMDSMDKLKFRYFNLTSLAYIYKLITWLKFISKIILCRESIAMYNPVIDTESYKLILCTLTITITIWMFLTFF